MDSFNTTATLANNINGTDDKDDAEVKQLLLIIPICLLVGNILRHICIEFRLILPYTVLLLLVGMIFGWIEQSISGTTLFGDSVNLIESLSPDMLLAIFIPPLVFESAFGTDYHIIRREFVQAIILAIPGVLLNVMFTSIFCYYVFPYGWSWSESLTFSSIISATDPVAVVSLLRELGASPKLATLIEGESLLNDGSAFVLFVVTSQFITESSPPTAGEIVVQFASLTFGGLIIGVVSGLIVVVWIRLVFNDERIEIVVTLIACYLCYWFCENGFSEHIHASGVLGCVFLGLCVSKYQSAITPSVQESLHAFWEVFSYICNTLIFIFSGMIIVLGVFNSDNTESHAVNTGDFGRNFLLYVILHIARSLTIIILYYPLKYSGFGIDWKQIIVLVFGGLRGVIGLSLALIIKLDNSYDTGYQHQVMFHIAGIVFWTLLINATGMQYIVDYLGLSKLKKSALPVLKAEMSILESQTNDKIEGMKCDPVYAGANWRNVVASLPSYVSILSSNFEKHSNPLKRYLTKAHSINGYYTNTRNGTKSQNAATFYPESKCMSMRFMDLQEYENETSQLLETETDSEQWSQPLLTPINSNKLKKTLKPINSNDLVTRFDYGDRSKWDEFKCTDSEWIGTDLSAKPVASLLDAKLPSLRLIMNTTNLLDKEKVTKISKTELEHRVLSVLQTSFDSAFEEGIISLDSYLILKNAVNCALDDTDLKVLETHIFGVFEINKCLENIYTKFGGQKLMHFLFLHELKRAIEVGLIFIRSVDQLKGKMACIPIIAKSYKLAPILDSLAESVEYVQQKWLQIQHKYPEVYSSIQTRLAVHTIIEHEQNEILQLYNYGLLDEREYSKMIQLLQKTQHHLYYSSWNYITKIHLSLDDIQETVRSVVWISKLRANPEQKVQYLFANMIHRKYNKNDVVVQQGEMVDGLHIVVSGHCICTLQANPNPNLNRDTESAADNAVEGRDSFTFTKGVFFPSWSYLTRSVCLYSVYTKTAVETCFVPNAVMQHLLEDAELNEIVETEAYLSLWKSCASYVLWIKHKQVRRGNIIDIFFNTLSRTEICIICQKSTFKEFNSNDEADRIYLNSSHLMLLLYGTGTAGKQVFNSGDLLLPNRKACQFEKGSKILILDYNIKHSLPSPMKRINRTFTFRKL